MVLEGQTCLSSVHYVAIVKAYKKKNCACQIHLHEAFLKSQYNPKTLIALWIRHVHVAVDNILSINELSLDQQILTQEKSLDDVIGALKSHEVSLDSKILNDINSSSIASTLQL